MCCHLYYSARLLICQPDWNIFFKPVYHLNPFGNKFIFWWLIAVVFEMVLTFYNCICFSHKISPLCIKLYENMLVQYAYLSSTPHKGNRQTTVSCTVSRELHPCMVLMQPPNAVTRSRREYHYTSRQSWPYRWQSDILLTVLSLGCENWKVPIQINKQG